MKYKFGVSQSDVFFTLAQKCFVCISDKKNFKFLSESNQQINYDNKYYLSLLYKVSYVLHYFDFMLMIRQYVKTPLTGKQRMCQSMIDMIFRSVIFFFHVEAIMSYTNVLGKIKIYVTT